METNESCEDSYLNYYQTPKKIQPTTTNPKPIENKKVFNPYQKEEPKHKEERKIEKTQDDFPEFVDLTKNAYAEGKNKNINKTETSDDSDDGEELPLLEELGISPENIKKKLISVLTFHKIDKQILEDADMAGPFFVFLLFGLSLVLVRLFNLN
jgi:hypothetical protein